MPYPAPDSGSYPAPENDWIGPAIGSQRDGGDPYPAPAQEPTIEGVRFAIDRPLRAGQTTVTGAAPENTFVILSDITYAGQTLGEGQSDENGRFSIVVSPLTGGNRVGLSVSTLQGSQSMAEVVQEYYPYRGEGYIEVPNVGVFFDSALVEP